MPSAKNDRRSKSMAEELLNSTSLDTVCASLCYALGVVRRMRQLTGIRFSASTLIEKRERGSSTGSSCIIPTQ